MDQSISQVRTLAHVSYEEAQNLFTLGFGFAPPLDSVTNRFQPGLLSFRTISDDTFTMILYQGGGMTAFRQEDASQGTPTAVNILKVVGYLALRKIDYERQEAPAQSAVSVRTSPSPSMVGPLFTFQPQPAIMSQSVDELMQVASHWCGDEMLNPPATLDAFKTRLEREIGYMVADGHDLNGIEVQWMDEACTVLAIATTVVPVIVVATIKRTEPIN